MSSAKEIVIERKSRLTLIISIICLYMVSMFAKSIYEDVTDKAGIRMVTVLETIVNLAGIAVFAVIGTFAIRRNSDKKPGLIINRFGVLDNSGLVPCGMVYWADIQEINKGQVFLSDCIVIKVKNPSRYLSNQKNSFHRFWLNLENRRSGTPFKIKISGLKYSPADLFRLLQDRYLNSHVESKTYELKKEKAIILREKDELLDSINYARRIQTALLPSTTNIQTRIGENFILYLPKNIVSGDFYWIETEGDYIFFAVCDCTGHGVPGALINILCMNALNRAVREYGMTDPGKILDKVADIVIDSIGTDGLVSDGMDAGLCSFNRNTRELHWAGANIPLWIARQSVVYEMIEYKPDKQSVGQSERRQPFTTHKIDISKDDLLYMASDGYADQFGGEAGKKLTRKKFKELLLLQKGKSLEEQKNNLLKFHTDYKGKGDQIDDILVMGVRVER